MAWARGVVSVGRGFDVLGVHPRDLQRLIGSVQRDSQISLRGPGPWLSPRLRHASGLVLAHVLERVSHSLQGVEERLRE